MALVKLPKPEPNSLYSAWPLIAMSLTALLTPEERTLRNQLRAHGRQLGDKLDPQRGGQTINHLKQAVAYEHWHRLLFARFLAENDLLMHPEHGVALSLDEVKEICAREWARLD